MKKDINEIDKLAKEAFENFEPDFNPEDWHKMEQKLNKRKHLMPYIWLYKGTEAFIFMLIIFTAFNFLNIFSNQGTESQLNNLQISSKTDQIVKEAYVKSNDLSKSQIKENENSAKNDRSLTLKNNTYTHASIESLNSYNAFEANNYNTTSGNSIKKISEGTLLNKKQSDFGANQSFINDTHIETQNNTVNKMIAFNETDLSKKESNFGIIIIEPIKKLGKNHNLGDGVEEGKGFAIKSNFKFPKLYRRQMRAALYAGADINFNNSLGQGKIGFSLTGLIEQEISDRFAIRAGLQLSRKSFENLYTLEYVNPFDENSIYSSVISKNTDITMIFMPIHLNTILYRDEKWRISLSTGFAAGILSNRNVSGTQRTSIVQTSGTLTNISEINGNEYRNGVLQGGCPSQNFFMAAALGADIERQLGDRVTLFVQPIFSHNLNRLGTDKERYGQLSLNAGVKTVIR